MSALSAFGPGDSEVLAEGMAGIENALDRIRELRELRALDEEIDRVELSLEELTLAGAEHQAGCRRLEELRDRRGELALKLWPAGEEASS